MDGKKREHIILKGNGASKMKTRNKMLKMGGARSFSINLWQSKNTKVFVPIRIYTDPLTKVLLIMQLVSSPSSWLGSSPICHDYIRCTPLDMILPRRCRASYLTTSYRGGTSHLSADRFHAGSTTALSPSSARGQQKVQAIKAKLAQKGKCPQYVFTFISKPHTV